MSFETSFDSKQPKLEPKIVSALSETKRLFRLFRFHVETASFDVSIKPKLTERNPKQTETNLKKQASVLSLEMYCMLPPDVSVLQQPVLSLDMRPPYTNLCCSCLWTNLFYSAACAVIELARCSATCAAPGHTNSSAACAAFGRVCPTAANAASGPVCQQFLLSLKESVLKQTLLPGCVNSIAACAALSFSSLTASVLSVLGSAADCAAFGLVCQPRAHASSGRICYKAVCVAWTGLFYRSLCCLWTGHICSNAACAASELVCPIQKPELPLHGSVLLFYSRLCCMPLNVFVLQQPVLPLEVGLLYGSLCYT